MRDIKDILVAQHLVFDAGDADLPINRVRETALEKFETTGFPTTDLEDWKYVNLKDVLPSDFVLDRKESDFLSYEQVKSYLVHDIESYRIVFVDGKYSSFLSKTTHDEADICVLSSVNRKEKYQPILENHYNKIADNKDAMVALNTATTRDGAYIYIPKNTVLSCPIQVIYFTTKGEKSMMNFPRNLVILGDNAQAKIIERHQSLCDNQAHFSNSVTELSLGKNAHLDYYKIQNDHSNSSLVDSTYTAQERDSVASVHTFSLGGKLTRNNLYFQQNGENCNSILKGVTLGSDQQLIDHHTTVQHIAPNCESHELYRTILDDASVGVFNGKVLVDAEAQKLDAFQQNNNILLTEEASIYTKPQLEIFADDVKCSHGCTIGQLDQDALFYMQSRGIPKKEAKALLLFAFAADVLESIDIPELKKRITRNIAEKLEVDLNF